MRKKILYIITKSDIGGAQKYVNDLAKNLNNNLFETKILYGGKEIKRYSLDFGLKLILCLLRSYLQVTFSLCIRGDIFTLH